MSQQHSCSFDHRVSTQQERFWDRKTDGLRSLEIDSQFELGRLLNGYVSRLPALQNPLHKLGAMSKSRRSVSAE